MKYYALYCELSTMKCNEDQLSAFLHGYSGAVIDFNKRLWLFQVDDSLFIQDLGEIHDALVMKGLVDGHSDFCLIEYNSLIHWNRGIDIVVPPAEPPQVFD